MTDLKVLIESKNYCKAEIDESQRPISLLALTNSLLRDTIIFHSNFFRYVLEVHSHKEESHKNIIIVNIIKLLGKTYHNNHELTTALGTTIL